MTGNLCSYEAKQGLTW